MDVCDGPLTFSQLHSLVECIEKCKFIDDARTALSTNPCCEIYFELCNCVILKLAQCYGSNERTACHALMVSQTFISTQKMEDFKRFSPTVPIRLYWVCVSMVCYALSCNFHEIIIPKLEDMLTITNIPYSSHAKKFYKRAQMHVLESIKWKLHFPTGEIRCTR
jgi:hypothetical protein